MNATNIQTVQEVYRSSREKDYEAFRSLCATDLEWIQNEGFPRGATWRGAQAVIDGVFRAFDSVWAEWGFDTEQFLDAGNSVVVVGKYRGRHKVSGKSFSASTAHIFDLKDQRIFRFRQFTDTKVICDSMV